MKKVIISAVIILAVAGIYLTSVGYIGKKKQNTFGVVHQVLSDKLPQGLDSAYIENMIALGMNATKEATLLTYTKERRHWKNEFGVAFMGDNEMTEFLKDNNFILGEASRYLKMVPIEAGKSMIKNIYKILQPNKKKYRYYETAGSAWIINEEDLSIHPKEGQTFENCNMSNSEWVKIIKPSALLKYGLPVDCHSKIMLEPTPINKIFIIGSAKEFNTEGMTIEDGILKAPAPKDPIAVLKVPNGYVELASWE